MEVNYIFRNSRVGYSIQTVFQTVIDAVQGHVAVRETFLPSPFVSVVSILRNGIYVRLHQSKNEVSHVTGDVHYLLYFLKKGKIVVTVHDIMYYHYLKGIKRKIWKKLYIDSLKKAAYVTFISEFARQQVFKEINLPCEKVAVIPNAVDPAFVYESKEFNVECPKILHIGTLERKNLARTIEALHGVSCQLRIIGKLNEATMKLLQKSGVTYSIASNLTHAEIVEEYRQADIINFPSTYEGFGMPIIEGQATGRIVVTSNISPMKEVAGEGAYIVDPYSVDSIKKAYTDILSSSSLRETLLKKGKENVKKYEIKEVARQYMSIYTSIAHADII